MLRHVFRGGLYNGSYDDQKDKIVMTKEEGQEMADIDNAMSALRSKKISRLREMARAKGLAADKLEDMKSRCGTPFVEEKEKTFGGCKVATAGGKESATPLELAYFCSVSFFGCGWVKGAPRNENYDELRPLSGSAGTRFFCKICGIRVGEHRLVVS